MTDMNRRDLFRAGLAGAAVGGASAITGPLRAAAASESAMFSANGADRLITVFLRGGMDAVHAVIPKEDPTYRLAREDASDPEQSLYVDPLDTRPLNGSTYAVLHKNLEKLGGDPGDLGSPDNRGEIAWIHQVGNPDGRRSHFDEQQAYETAYAPPTILDAYEEEGVIPRLFDHLTLPGTVTAPFASVSQRMQQMFRSTVPGRIGAHVKSLARYSIGSGGIAAGQEGALAAHLAQNPTAELESYVDSVGEFVFDTIPSINGLANYQHDPIKFPRDSVEAAAVLPADYVGYVPGYAFTQSCEEVMQLILDPNGPRVAGIEFGGWDTHVGQRASRDLLDAWFAYGLRSLYDCTRSFGVTILVLSEFGRTNNANSNFGTDHGDGGLAMVLGQRVNGGVYNCSDGSELGHPWIHLGVSSDNAQPVATDFRTIYAELFQKLFGLSGSSLDTVIPGWSGFTGSQYDSLNLIT